jgi:exonuclease III
LDLRKLEMSNRKFTWANALDTPTYERLDRVLVSTDWELKFPLATVIALNREISDHTPLLLDTGEENQASSHSRFKFELSCLLTEDFLT